MFSGTYQQWLAYLRNTAVYEGTQNTMLTCPVGTGDRSAWTVRPTSEAFAYYQITNSPDSVFTTVTGHYALNQTGLIIRNATPTPTGGPIATAGFYMVEFPINRDSTAVKLVVIRK